MTQDGNTGEGETKRTSKLSAMLGNENEGFNGLQIAVYYSENNWETCEEVNLILDENTTINQLIDSAVYKFKTELYYDNIDKKQFNVMLFKKKKKVPNDEYPACNPESKVKDYGKDNFCLVEDTENSKKEIKQEKKEDKIEGVKEEANTASDKNNNSGNLSKDDTSEKEEEINNMYKTCSPKCVSCIIV